MAWLLHNSLFIPALCAPRSPKKTTKKTQPHPKPLQQQQHQPNNTGKEKKEEVHLMRKTLSLATVKTPSSLYLL